MAQELVQPDLDLEGFVLVSVVDILVLVADERCWLFRCARAQNVAERNIFEALVLADIIVIRDIDT